MKRRIGRVGRRNSRPALRSERQRQAPGHSPLHKYNPRLLNFRGGRWLGWTVAVLIIGPMAWQHYQRSLPQNGFQLDRLGISVDQIVSGGPGRDDIPALTDPRTAAPSQADFLAPDAPVIGLAINGRYRAYPYQILNWHEIVNDRLGGQAVVISYCPLCGSGMAFSGMVEGRRLLLRGAGGECS